MAPSARTIALPSGEVLVRLVGELDIDAVSSLKEHLACASEVSPSVVIDMREVTFVDAAVIGALVGVQQRLTAGGGGLGLVGATPWIVKVLRAAEVDGALPLHPDLDAALSSMRAAPVVGGR